MSRVIVGAVIGVGVLGGIGGLVWYYRRKLGIGGMDALSTGGSGPGWSAGSDVQLSEDLGDFVTTLAEESGETLYVTSGIRTAEDQARALLKKMELGEDYSALMALYKRDDLIQELAKVPQDLAAWRQTIQAQIDRGDLLSSHLSGYALDIRSKTLSSDAQKRVIAAAKDLGARVVVEDTPPHIHLELRDALT